MSHSHKAAEEKIEAYGDPVDPSEENVHIQFSKNDIDQMSSHGKLHHPKDRPLHLPLSSDEEQKIEGVVHPSTEKST
jgi:hypothetical protein